jgi:hypothetical protein
MTTPALPPGPHRPRLPVQAEGPGPSPRPPPAAHRDHRPGPLARPSDTPLSIDPAGIRRADLFAKGKTMSKDKNRGNREAKKPKKDKPKVSATANTGTDKADTVIGGKKIK